MDEELITYNEAEAHLYLCNCINDSSRAAPEFHSKHCQYFIWYKALEAARRKDKIDKGKE